MHNIKNIHQSERKDLKPCRATLVVSEIHCICSLCRLNLTNMK